MIQPLNNLIIPRFRKIAILVAKIFFFTLSHEHLISVFLYPTTKVAGFTKLLIKTKLQKEYDNIIDAIKTQLHQQNLNQYEKQITNTKLPKNDINIIKKTWKQDKQQAHELICWCYDIITIQAIVDDNI